MDWFSWLTKTGLEPSLVYEYGLAFANNELEEEDIVYFNHEFLQSMGISIAKHRLEILKLARKEPKNHVLKHPISKLLFVLKKTKKSLTKYISTLVHPREEDRALIVVSNKNKNNNSMMRINKGGAISYSTRWKRAMMAKNNRKLVTMNGNNHNEERLMITNGDYMGEDDQMVVSTPRLDTFSSPLMYDLQQNKEDDKLADDDHEEDADDDQYWSPTVEEIRYIRHKLVTDQVSPTWIDTIKLRMHRESQMTCRYPPMWVLFDPSQACDRYRPSQRRIAFVFFLGFVMVGGVGEALLKKPKYECVGQQGWIK